MNDLIVKNVSFCKAELLAIQDKETGKIYAGINSILRELGFDEKQIEYRRDKWTSDKAISKGTRKFSGTLIGAGTGKDVWCIDTKKLPIALAKIDITPKMENEMPELSEKLEKYQDECADILADAFISKQDKMILPKDFPSALRAYADEYEKNMLLEQKNDTLNNGGSKKKGTLDFINDDELPQAISTAVALCREHSIDISDIIQKKAS